MVRSPGIIEDKQQRRRTVTIGEKRLTRVRLSAAPPGWAGTCEVQRATMPAAPTASALLLSVSAGPAILDCAFGPRSSSIQAQVLYSGRDT